MGRGIGASSGIAIGRAYVLPVLEWDFPDKMVDVTDLALELEKLHNSIRFSKGELEAIKQDISELIGEEESHIFNAHLAILEDPIFITEVRSIMQRQYKAAEVAVKETIDKFVNMFDLLDDDYMKERAADIKDVGNRLLKHLLGNFQDASPPLEEPYVLVAKELTPSQLANVNPSEVLGIVTFMGGMTSHAVIMARAMGIPFVVGMEGKIERPIQTGDFLIVDGDDGVVLINPEPALIEEYRNRHVNQVARREMLQEIVEVPPVTRDGRRLVLKANINSLKELEQALKNGVSSVGLFRTEFIFMDRSVMPSEEEQMELYKQAAEKLNGNSLDIRALDIGGDKMVSYLPLPAEENPSMGYRSIRILLDRKDLFHTQLRAVLRASLHGNIRLLFPMISSLDEVWKAKEALEEAKRELEKEGVPYNKEIPIGIMIEIPAAVAIADLLAREVDFFSIGTNDLVQYVLAVDRMNESVAHLYDPFHPAVLRMLQMTVEAAKRHGIPVSVCGEMAGDQRAIPLWLGLGIEEISMSVQSILPVKDRLLKSDGGESASLLSRALNCRTSEEIRQLFQFNSCETD
ncbi:phosphoenolpyruvate--protein phosphotransferase [Paenibacillus aurantius]|uniref:Phosphoenolpyruvate-protein phosphotransferase n=1 Tax=Paenibacillus aurantius TaxID=2918900 RepID=A0AA96LGV7_9BACL|nr:phosphoenolpyruvate--protein phosphotransferase [Paenibacillus aurantius]WNQ13626.1 phosphoenolpyruvate--protein phosphotransferase [Paenibacillus aurantius]